MSKLKARINYNFLITGTATFLSCFILSFVINSFAIQPQGTKAVTGLTLVSAPTMTLTANSSSVTINPNPSSNDGQASAATTLTASTNVPTGYNIMLSAPSISAQLAATSGTLASPIALANNTWGYALTKVSSSSSANTVVNGFDATYTAPIPSTTSKYANPTTPTVIKNTTVAASGEQTNIWYAAKANMALPSGAYTSTVTYTATANISTIPAPSITSVSPSTGSAAGGHTITIVGTGFTVNDQSVTTGVTIGGVTCRDVSISSNTPTTGQDTLWCDTSAHAAGVVDVVVTTWSSTATLANGFTYITPATVSFVSPSVASTIAGTESGPAFTIVGNEFTGATAVYIGGKTCTSFEVVSDTHIFCEGPNNITTTGDNIVVVTKQNAGGNSTIAVTYNSTAYPTLQGSDAYANCSTTAKLYRDTRDSQLYYVKRMPDEKCWMVDNLKYANFGELSQETGKYLTVDGTATQGTANYDVAKYVDPGATDYCAGSANMPANTNTRCGLLYNWYAATNGTGTYAESVVGTNVDGSICPANFRLPSGSSDGVTPTGDGSSHATADFAVLNASMNAGVLSTGSTSNFYTNWQHAGPYSGVYAGYWYNKFDTYGSYWWSSTVLSTPNAQIAQLYSTGVFPGNTNYSKPNGTAVRCVMDGPGPAPTNISSTNPAILDVYPTTGWANDIITITSNARFTDIISVSVGGKTCLGFSVPSTSVIRCRLPANTAGTTNAIKIEYYVDGEDVGLVDYINSDHLKITYFNPNSSSVTISSKTYSYYANSFVSADCSAMTASNAPIGTEPVTSLAYVRDARNNQVYRVKKMVDNKCWMVDNLKYTDPTITYNNGDHKNDGGTTAYNTIDETNAQSDANSNKAFYNNPMGIAYCQNGSGDPTGTLTKCGYLYNWYAATNGIGTYAEKGDTNVAGSVCPANFRLPSALSDSSSPTGDGATLNVADLPVLNASMNTGALSAGASSNWYSNWQPTGPWGGVFAGLWNNKASDQSTGSWTWSSTATSDASIARNLVLSPTTIGPNSTALKYHGFSVRCVLK